MRYALAVAAVVVGVAPLARAGGAPIALLVPEQRLCLEGRASIVIGVRYTANPVGPRWYSVEVRDPRGRVILRRRGVAPRSWRRWRHDPRSSGVYRTVYRTSTNRESFRTRVLLCRE